MTVSSHRLVDRRTVRGALALAAAAPSVRNSQPWRWEVGRDAVHLHADLARWLPAADPMGRDLVMSCGAALHHARVALGDRSHQIGRAIGRGVVHDDDLERDRPFHEHRIQGLLDGRRGVPGRHQQVVLQV